MAKFGGNMKVYCTNLKGWELRKDHILPKPTVGNIYVVAREGNNYLGGYYVIPELQQGYDGLGYFKKYFIPVDEISIEELTEVLENVEV